MGGESRTGRDSTYDRAQELHDAGLQSARVYETLSTVDAFMPQEARAGSKPAVLPGGKDALCTAVQYCYTPCASIAQAALLLM